MINKVEGGNELGPLSPKKRFLQGNMTDIQMCVGFSLSLMQANGHHLKLSEKVQNKQM